MNHTYDWSKLDAGWKHRPGTDDDYQALIWLTRGNDLGRCFLIKELEIYEHIRSSDQLYLELWPKARAQLAKCRVEPKPEPKAKYDWSKLGAGWEVFFQGQVLLCSGRRFAVAELEMRSECLLGDDEYRELWPEARRQLDKCRVVDNTPLFNAMDKMAAEVPAEEWAKWETKAIGLPEDITVWGYQPPPPPWRRGPLASWTLVNISAHDGRLTVVMKRGRGELIIETGPDDETLWERLGAKVVEVDKAKAKAAAEAKEKSDG